MGVGRRHFKHLISRVDRQVCAMHRRSSSLAHCTASPVCCTARHAYCTVSSLQFITSPACCTAKVNLIIYHKHLQCGFGSKHRALLCRASASLTTFRWHIMLHRTNDCTYFQMYHKAPLHRYPLIPHASTYWIQCCHFETHRSYPPHQMAPVSPICGWKS